MEKSETLPQPEPGGSKPIGAVPFEVVRQAEFVFEPFVGSLIQLPEIRMQRAQSSEFFLAQSPTQRESADPVGEEALVWERPQQHGQSPAASKAEEPRNAVQADNRKAKSKKPAKDQEGPRFYQPPTVRFFDPMAAAGEDDGAAEEGELTGPRASTQLSPELKAAILRIDEQRRQAQQGVKQEKPSGKKKRGFLTAKPAARADVHDIPIEIVKPRDVVLTERAARWEEIAAPPPKPATPEVSTQSSVPAEPLVEVPVAEVVPPLEMAPMAVADVEQIASIDSVVAPSSELPSEGTIATYEEGALLDAAPTEEEISIDTTAPLADAEQPAEIIPVFAQESAVPEEIVVSADLAAAREEPTEPEIVLLHEAALEQEAISADSAGPLTVQPTPDMLPAIEQEAVAAEEMSVSHEFSSQGETPTEPEIVPLHEAALSQEAILTDAPNAPPMQAVPIEMLPAIEQEAIAAEEMSVSPEFASQSDSLFEPEAAPPPKAAFAQDAIPIDASTSVPVSDWAEETILAEQEGSITDEIISTLQFALTDDDLREPELAETPEAVSLSTSTSASTEPPIIASTIETEKTGAQAAVPDQTAAVPPAFTADASPAWPMTAEPEETGSTARFREITANISRANRAEIEIEPVKPATPQIPIEKPSEGEAEPRKKKGKLPLASRLQRWIGGASLDGNRRRADRVAMPGLVAFYWSGGSPRPHEIVNISKTGFYLKTREFWSLETLVRMTLQRPPTEMKPKAESISVLARVVRIDEDGVGHEFVTTEALKHAHSMDVMPSQGTDTRALDKFLKIQ